MKTSMKRILLLLLSFIFILSAFAGCGKKEEPNEESTVETQTDTTVLEIPYELPLTDFEGAEVTILALDGKIWQFEKYASNSEKINQAIYERNEILNEKLNCELTMAYANGPTDFSTKITQEALTQSGAYDLVFSEKGQKPMAYGYYYNLLECPEVALDQPFFAQGYNDVLTINNTLYGAVGYGSINYMERTSAITYNKDMYESLFEGSIYDYVDNMSWTLETMKIMAQGAKHDKTGDGMDANDIYGAAVSLSGGSALLFSTGAKFMPIGNDGKPTYEFLNQRNVDLFDNIYSLMNEEYVTYRSSYLDIRDCFAAGNCLFALNAFSATKMIKQSGTSINFGILPYPMLDSEQEEYISTCEGSEDFSILMSTKSREKSAILLNAFNYYSYALVRPAYYDAFLKLQAAEDADDSRMIDLIMKNVYLDFGYVYNTELGGYCTYAFTMAREHRNEYSSFYSSAETAVKERLNNLIDAYTNADIVTE